VNRAGAPQVVRVPLGTCLPAGVATSQAHLLGVVDSRFGRCRPSTRDNVVPPRPFCELPSKSDDQLVHLWEDRLAF
jgi:hypothetical protein